MDNRLLFALYDTSFATASKMSIYYKASKFDIHSKIKVLCYKYLLYLHIEHNNAQACRRHCQTIILVWVGAEHVICFVLLLLMH